MKPQTLLEIGKKGILLPKLANAGTRIYGRIHLSLHIPYSFSTVCFFFQKRLLLLNFFGAPNKFYSKHRFVGHTTQTIIDDE